MCRASAKFSRNRWKGIDWGLALAGMETPSGLATQPRFWLLAAVATAASAFWLFSADPSRNVPEEAVAMQPARPAAERSADAAKPALQPGAAAGETDLGPELAATVEVSSLTAEESAEAEGRRAAARSRSPRDETPEKREFEKRARDEAERRGVELPPELRAEIDDLEPLPGESEQEFAERRKDLENAAIAEELLVDALLWRRYRRQIYRMGEPVSQYEGMARVQVAGMPLERQEAVFGRSKWRDEGLGEPTPRFYPPNVVAPYDGPDAEVPPPNFTWAEPDS